MSIVVLFGWLLLLGAALSAWRAYQADVELRRALPPGLEHRRRDNARSLGPTSLPWVSLESLEVAVHSVLPPRWRHAADSDQPPAALNRVLEACIAAGGLTIWGIVALSVGLA